MRWRAIFYAIALTLVLTVVVKKVEAKILRPPRKPKNFMRNSTSEPRAPAALPSWAEVMREEARKEREELHRREALQATVAPRQDEPALEPTHTSTMTLEKSSGATAVPAATPAIMTAQARLIAPTTAPSATHSLESTFTPTRASIVTPHWTIEHSELSTETDIYNRTRNIDWEDSNPPRLTAPITAAKTTIHGSSEITTTDFSNPRTTPITSEQTTTLTLDQSGTSQPGVAPLLNATVNPLGIGHSCIFAFTRVMLTVPYKNMDSQNVTINLPVPSYAQPGGTCEGDEKSQQLFYTWKWRSTSSRSRSDAAAENQVRFSWTKKGEKFVLSQLSMSITKTKIIIPDLDVADAERATASRDGLALFEAPVGSAYACYGAASEVELGGGAAVTLSEVLLQAFSADADQVGPAVHCSPGDSGSSAAWIVVGCALAALALAVAVAFAAQSTRARRGHYFVHLSGQGPKASPAPALAAEDAHYV